MRGLMKVPTTMDGNMTYRYASKATLVYPVVRKLHCETAKLHCFGTTQFFTIPVQQVLGHQPLMSQGPSTSTLTCLLAFADPTIAGMACTEVETETGLTCEAQEHSLAYIEDVSSCLQLPALVILNSYCNVVQTSTDLERAENYEVYFSRPRNNHQSLRDDCRMTFLQRS